MRNGITAHARLKKGAYHQQNKKSIALAGLLFGGKILITGKIRILITGVMYTQNIIILITGVMYTQKIVILITGAAIAYIQFVF